MNVISEIFSLASPQEVTNRLVAKLTANETDPDERRWLLRKLDLVESATTEAIKKIISQRIQRYSARLAEIEQRLPGQQAAISGWLKSQGLETAQELGDISVFFYDSVLGIVVPEIKRRTSGGQFLPQLNSIVLDLDSADWVIVHEYAHGLAYNTETSRSGFRTILENGLTDDGRSNGWLDEYCAMNLEFAITEHTLENRKEEDELYFAFYEMGEVFLQEIGVKKELLLKVYYGHMESQQEIEERCRRRYNCSVFDLDDVLLGFNDELREMTLDLLKGKPVFYQRHLQKDNGGLEDKYRRMAELFPNFSYKIETF